MSDEQSKSSGSNLMMPMIILVIIVVVVGVWYITRTGVLMTPEPATPSFYDMAPVIVNLEGDRPKHYLKVAPVIVSKNPELEVVLEDYKPMIRSYLLSRLRQERVDALGTQNSYERVRQSVTEGIKALVLEHSGVDHVDDVIFTEFVIQ